MRVAWSNIAEEDLNGILDHILRENPRAARRVVREIQDAGRQLARFPRLGHPGRLAGTRELVVSRAPYVLIYRVEASGVTILHVYHQAQDEWTTC